MVTITGVVGCEGGEQLGVTNSPLLGDKLMAWAGERGGWSGGGLVGVMPGISTGLDINWVGGWEKFSTHNSARVAGWVGKVFHSQLRSAASQEFSRRCWSSYWTPVLLTEGEPVN